MASREVEDFKRRYVSYSIQPPTYAQQYREFYSVIDRGTGKLESGQYFDIGLLDFDRSAFMSGAKVLLSEIKHSIFLNRTVEDEPESQPFSLGAVPFGLTDVQLLVERHDETGLHFLPSLIVRGNIDVRLNGIPVVKEKKYRLAAFDCISFHRKSNRLGANNSDEVPAILYKPGFNKIDLEDTKNPYKFIKPKEGENTIDFPKIRFKLGFGHKGFLDIRRHTHRV
jgi:hypothetical protein